MATKISDLEQEVLKKEGIRVIIRRPVNQHVSPYLYVVRAPDEMTVEQFIRQRLMPYSVGDVVILVGTSQNGAEPNQTLWDVRYSYRNSECLQDVVG